MNRGQGNNKINDIMKLNEYIEITNEDNMELMKRYPDKFFDLALVDPPFGINITSSGRLKKYNTSDTTWDNSTPTKEYFDELFRISKNQIIWGGNYFIEYLKNTKCFLIYDKKQPEGISFASCEMACELDKDYFESSIQRVKAALQTQSLF